MVVYLGHTRVSYSSVNWEILVWKFTLKTWLDEYAENHGSVNTWYLGMELPGPGWSLHIWLHGPAQGRCYFWARAGTVGHRLHAACWGAISLTHWFMQQGKVRCFLENLPHVLNFYSYILLCLICKGRWLAKWAQCFTVSNFQFLSPPPLFKAVKLSCLNPRGTWLSSRDLWLPLLQWQWYLSLLSLEYFFSQSCVAGREGRPILEV